MVQAGNANFMRNLTDEEECPVATGVARVFYSDMGHFGHAIRRLRKAKRWTQTELAVKAGMSLAWVQKTEASPEPKLFDASYRTLAEALGVTPEVLDKEWREDRRTVSLPEDVMRSAEALAERSKISVEEWFINVVKAQSIRLRRKIGEKADGKHEASHARG